MPKLIRKLSRIFAMEWSKMIQYRADILLWMTTETMVALISMAVWYTVAKSSPTGPSPLTTFTYYIFVMFVFIITNAWNGFFLAQEILYGEIVRYLIRPISALWPHIANNIVEKSIKLLIPVPALAISMWIFPHIFDPAIFVVSHWLLFIPSLVLAVALASVLDINFGAAAFWLEDAIQLRGYKDTLQIIASGLLIPFAFLPPTLHRVLSALPFRYIISAPIEIMLGQAQGSEVIKLIVYQILWITLLSFLFSILWRQGLKRYAVPGQ